MKSDKSYFLARNVYLHILDRRRRLEFKHIQWWEYRKKVSCMPVIVHKILLHRPDVMKHFFMPIGQFSEEADEFERSINVSCLVLLLTLI